MENLNNSLKLEVDEEFTNTQELMDKECEFSNQSCEPSIKNLEHKAGF